jgi:hypothetical protein
MWWEYARGKEAWAWAECVLISGSGGHLLTGFLIGILIGTLNGTLSGTFHVVVADHDIRLAC